MTRKFATAALLLATATALSATESPRPPRYPSFARTLASAPPIAGPSAWARIPRAKAWRAIATGGSAKRQQARWDFALSLIGEGLAAEALAVLDVLAQDDSDLALADSYRLARGAALVQLDRPAEAIEAMAGSSLAANPEACAWRMRAFEDARLAARALEQLGCARPALLARKPADRARFAHAAARAAIAAEQPAVALKWLDQSPKDSENDLLAGRALLALGRRGEAKKRLDRVAKAGTYRQRLDAELSLIEARAARRAIKPAEALKALDRIRFAWRGGSIEERALRLSYRLGSENGDLRAALSAGHALVRYFDLGASGPGFAAGLQQRLASALDPANAMPIDQALGLYWDYRYLAPLGADGDLLVVRLAERLQGEGLYARAAELLEHQLFERAKDLAQGPLSVRVATLHILAGRPERAIDAFRRTSEVPYPDAMIWDRRRVEAVALNQLGRTAEAMAALQSVPGGRALIAEILWKQRNWNAFASATAPALPRGGALSDVEQAIVLRHAVALAMTGREDRIAALRVRYAESFAGLPSATAFDALTGDATGVDAETLSAAMAAIPSASPAGQLADLLDRAPA